MHRLALLALLAPLAACPPDKSDDTAGSTGGSTTGDMTTGASTTATTTGVPVDDCAFLVGKTFSSDAELECGLGPDGPVPCHWMIKFTATGYEHQYSDVGESGNYTCQDGALIGTANDVQHAGTIDAATGKLTWDDVHYTVVP